MKLIRKLLITLLTVSLLCTTALAATGFNAKLEIDRSTEGVIAITVAHSSVLVEKKPTLSIPCDYALAKVTGPDGEVACTLEDGQVHFVVAKGGTYYITECISVEKVGKNVTVTVLIPAEDVVAFAVSYNTDGKLLRSVMLPLVNNRVTIDASISNTRLYFLESNMGVFLPAIWIS